MLGDYISFNEGSLGVNNEARKHIITLFQDLITKKNYKEETLYLASSLADRHLVNLAVRNEPTPCLLKLTVVCTLIAAKLEQPVQPSYKRMISLVKTSWQFEVGIGDALKLEKRVLSLINFDL